MLKEKNNIKHIHSEKQLKKVFIKGPLIAILTSVFIFIYITHNLDLSIYKIKVLLIILSIAAFIEIFIQGFFVKNSIRNLIKLFKKKPENFDKKFIQTAWVEAWNAPFKIVKYMFIITNTLIIPVVFIFNIFFQFTVRESFYIFFEINLTLSSAAVIQFIFHEMNLKKIYEEIQDKYTINIYDERCYNISLRKKLLISILTVVTIVFVLASSSIYKILKKFIITTPELRKLIYTVNFKLLIMVIFTLIILSLLIILITRVFSSPLNRLAKAMEDVKSGKLDVKLKIFRTDIAISKLFSGFNNMVNELKNKEIIESALEKSEEANRHKSEFLAIISHELRTPLTGIMGFSELLSNSGDIKGQNKDFSIRINRLSKKLHFLINDLLDISTIEAGKLNISYTNFNVENVIEDIILIFDDEIRKKKLIIETNVTDCNDIYSDQHRIRQIFLNLFGNAVKFTNEGTITINAEKKGNEYLFKVKDTGIGISKEDCKKIFQPFTQIEATYKRKYQGIGLGLSICKKLVEMLNGKIWCESELGKGSVFYFSIPT